MLYAKKQSKEEKKPKLEKIALKTTMEKAFDYVIHEKLPFFIFRYYIEHTY